MTSSIQPSTPPLGTTGLDEAPFFESTLTIEDQDNVLTDLKNQNSGGLFESIVDKENVDNSFTIEVNNTSGGIDLDANLFNDEEFGSLASAFTTGDVMNKEEEEPIPVTAAQSPVLIEVPSNANFFNLKSSQEYTIEEDQPFLEETFEMHQEKLEQEEKPSDVAPFSDASESSFMAGTSNLNDRMDMAPPTRLKFSVEGSYSSSSTTDPLTSSSAPSISIMESDDNPFSLTSPQDFSSNVSSNDSTSGSSITTSRSSENNSPPSKSVKTETKTSASQRLIKDDELSGYSSDVSGESEQQIPGSSKTPYFEIRVTLSQFNFFRVVRLPQLVNMNDLYVISMEALDWDDDKWREHPHYFRDEGGRIFASSTRTLSNVPPEEEANVKDEHSYLLNQVLKHERSSLTLYYSSKKDWIITIALQEIFDDKPPKDKYTQEVYCISGRGGSINEVDSSKEGKFDKANVNKRLQDVKFKSTE